MKTEFEFFTNNYTREEICVNLIVTFDIIANAEDDAHADNIAVWDGDIELPLESFSKEDQAKIEDLANELACSQSYEAYAERLEYQAELLYDSWKEGY